MKTRILKWGNSLAVRIPKAFANEMGIAEDSSIQMAMQEGSLIITPDCSVAWTLEALLAGVTKENLHEEWESDMPAGREEW